MSLTLDPIHALTDSVFEAIENLAFSEVESLTSELPAGPDQQHVRISLGNLGEMEMTIDAQTLVEFASVIMTLDPEALDEPAKRDTLMEIINIVAGRFCHHIVGDDQEFQLGLPKVEPYPRETPAQTITCSFSMDGHPALRFRYFPMRA